MLLAFHKDSTGLNRGKPLATFGIDVPTATSVPSRKGFKVDVCFDGDVSPAEITLADLLGLVLPLEQFQGELFPTDSNGERRVTVVLCVPSK